MKLTTITTLSITFIASLLISACSDFADDIATTSHFSNNHFNGVTAVVITDNGGIIEKTKSDAILSDNNALRFENEQVFEQYLTWLEDAGEEDRDNISELYGVTTLADLQSQACVELDSIAEACTSESDFTKEYSMYKKKYEGRLISNYIDETDLTMYAPVGEEEILSYVANVNGQYVIGNKIITLRSENLPYSVQLLSCLDDNSNYLPGIGPIPTNKLVYQPKKKRKVKFCISRKGYKINVSMNVQKKNWTGWHDMPYTWKMFQPELKNFTPKINKIDNLYHRFSSSAFNVYLGDGLPLQQLEARPKSVTGKVYFWTDYNLETTDKGGLISTGDLPLYTRNHAIVVNVDLPHTGKF